VSIGLDICDPTVDASQSTHTTSVDTAAAVTARRKPHPAVTKRPVRLHRRPAWFLETIQACRLVNRNSAARAPCRMACCDVTAAAVVSRVVARVLYGRTALLAISSRNLLG